MNSIQLWGIRTFSSIRTFLVKKSYTKIQYPFRVILILYAQFLTINVLILQNVLMPPPPPPPPTTPIVYYQHNIEQNVSIPLYCILPTHSSRKCFNTSILYTTNTHFYNSSINIRSIYFFSSSDMHQSYHLLGCN